MDLALQELGCGCKGIGSLLVQAPLDAVVSVVVRIAVGAGRMLTVLTVAATRATCSGSSSGRWSAHRLPEQARQAVAGRVLWLLFVALRVGSGGAGVDKARDRRPVRDGEL